MLQTLANAVATSIGLDFIEARNEILGIFSSTMKFVTEEVKRATEQINADFRNGNIKVMMRELDRLVGILLITDEAGITGDPKKVAQKMEAVRLAIEALPR